MSTIASVPDPHVALHRQLGERIVDARRETDRLTSILTHIDELRQKLREAGVEVQVDLGDVGNAAADMRRQLEAGAVQKFELPRAS